MKAIEAYDSAYPGSMSQREDGSYIRREDAESLAGALLALIRSGDRAAEDLQDALIEANKDAARYRWLREQNAIDWDGFPYAENYEHPDSALDSVPAMLDAAIDAAMKTPNVQGNRQLPAQGEQE